MSQTDNLGTEDWDRKDLTMKKLREYHDICNKRAEELSSATGLPLHHKVRAMNGARTYTAISSLLYTTVGLARIEDLEHFINKRGASLPPTIFSISEWSPVIALARQFRELHMEQPRLFEKITHIHSMYIALKHAYNAMKKESEDYVRQSNSIMTEMISAFEIFFYEMTAKFQRVNVEPGPEEMAALREQLLVKIKDIERLEMELAAQNSRRISVDSSAQILSLQAQLAEEKNLRIDIEQENRGLQESLALYAEREKNFNKLLREKEDEIVNLDSTIKDKITVSNVQEALLAKEEELAILSKNSSILRVELDAALLRYSELQGLVKVGDSATHLDMMMNDFRKSAEVELEVERTQVLSLRAQLAEEKNLRIDIEQENRGLQESLALYAEREKNLNKLLREKEDEIVNLDSTIKDLTSELARLSQESALQEEKLSSISSRRLHEQVHCHVSFSPLAEDDELVRLNVQEWLSGGENISFIADKAGILNAYFVSTKMSETDSNLVATIDSLKETIVTLEEDVQRLRVEASIQAATKDSAELQGQAESPPLDQSQAAEKIQKIVRGHLGRNRMFRIISGMNPDAMRPVNGTRRAGSGWYTQSKAYFYFCRDQRTKSFMTLCGPISESEYIASNVLAKGYSRYISIHTSAIIASHIHGETLIETTQILKSGVSLPPLVRRFSRTRAGSQGDIFSTGSTPRVVFREDDVINDLDKKLSTMQKELEATQSLNFSLRRKLSNHKVLTSGEISMGDKSRRAMKIQTRVRMLIAEHRVARIFVEKYAGTDMRVALPGTKNGSTGWYVCRNAYTYYIFVGGKLEALCGPMSETDYQEIYRATKIRHRTKTEQLLVESSGMFAVRFEINRLRAAIRNRDL